MPDGDLRPPHKRLVVCCDGTWNEPEEAAEDPADKAEPTNVLKVLRGVAPVDAAGVVQVAYYHQGVGTAGGLDKVLGGGLGLSTDVQEAYRFIANNHADGDHLYLFGFSRGAYTARSLAGFIGAVGLLEKPHLAWLPEAYKLYRTPPDRRPGSPWASALAKLDPTPRQGVPIHFIGVWDTVGALGVPTPMLGRISRRWVSFHDTGLGKDVRHAYHALAVDERRRPFKPDLWTVLGDPGQTVEQVWFPGVHSNVGGSYKNTVLSDLALAWMVGRAASHGLAFLPHLANLVSRPLDGGRVENSFTTGYQALRLLGVSPYEREIGAAQTGDEKAVPGINETIHGSAREALDGAPAIDFRSGCAQPYGAANLGAALDAGIPIWAAPGGPT